MSQDHSIRISLDLKDKNITFKENFCEDVIIKTFKSKLYHATLSYIPLFCQCCGIKNEQFQVVKNGYLTSRIKWISTSRFPTYIQLKKQRFLCRSCGATFVAQSDEIEPGCFIANKVKQAITIELKDAYSIKDLAKRHFLSPTTVHRCLSKLAHSFRNSFDSLPTHLCFDEFKSVKQVVGNMSFIYCDSITHKIVDILSNRQLRALRQHFYHYPLSVRQQVNTIVIDMNAPYFILIKELFPNAKVIIDRFHIIQLISRSLNKTRIMVMNQLNTSNGEDKKDYRKLKNYWRLLLKSADELNYQEYRSQRLFKKMMTETEIIDYLLSLDPVLKDTYGVYQELLYYSRRNEFEGFKEAVHSNGYKVSNYMKTSLRTLNKHLERIENTFIYTYNNGVIEGIINKIKMIKRVSYGYRSFRNFKARILISFNVQQKSYIDRYETIHVA